MVQPLVSGGSILFGGLAGALNAVNAFENFSPARWNAFHREMRAAALGGIALKVAPGFTAAFDTELNPNGPRQTWQFPTTLNIGWNSAVSEQEIGDANSGLLVSQFFMPEIYAAQPKAVAMKPRGRDYTGNQRALVGFGFTANFGVLDITRQTRFRNVPNPNPLILNLDPDFSWFIGVRRRSGSVSTPLPIWGALKARSGSEFIPSPDAMFQDTSDMDSTEWAFRRGSARRSERAAASTIPPAGFRERSRRPMAPGSTRFHLSRRRPDRRTGR